MPYALQRFHGPSRPEAVVLFLHGGQESSRRPVRRRHASWWRMAAMARGVGGFDGSVASYLLRFEVRGWNDPDRPSPVADTHRALEDLRERHHGLPLILVGHSMGGRTACRVADADGVIGVVALAPWLPDDETVATVAGRHVRVLHGTADTWTSPRLSAAWTERAAQVAASAHWRSLPGVGHFMFRRVQAWNGFVTDSVAEIRQRGTA